MDNAQSILQKIKQLKSKIDGFNSIRASFDDLMTLIEIGNEENDESIIDETKNFQLNLLKAMKNLELKHYCPDLMIKITLF